MHGLHLTELDASDMMDVIHYFFEEDMNFATPEQAEARSKARENLYQTMYGTIYKYAYSGKNGSKQQPTVADFDITPESKVDDLKPFDPVISPPKPYVPPTKFDGTSSDPFGGILDAPLR